MGGIGGQRPTQSCVCVCVCVCVCEEERWGMASEAITITTWRSLPTNVFPFHHDHYQTPSFFLSPHCRVLTSIFLSSQENGVINYCCLLSKATVLLFFVMPLIFLCDYIPHLFFCPTYLLVSLFKLLLLKVQSVYFVFLYICYYYVIQCVLICVILWSQLCVTDFTLYMLIRVY